jgi:hypothetical protein
MRAFGRVVLFLCWAGIAAAGGRTGKGTTVDFDEENVEGEVQRPTLEYVPGRPAPQFRCDATKLSLEEFNACFEKQVVDVCGMQVIERERYELQRFAFASAQSARGKTVGSSYPNSFVLEDGAVFSQQASEYEVWRDRGTVLSNQTPRLTSLDAFAVTKNALVFADKKSRRVLWVADGYFGEYAKPFHKIELASAKQELLGVLNNGSIVVATSKEVLRLGLDRRSGKRLDVPRDDYSVDPHVDRTGQLLLVSSAPGGKVYVVDARGEVTGSFPRESGYSYHLLPNGIVATADLSSGRIKIRSPSGVVLSQTSLSRPLMQFGVLRQRRDADLFFVAADGLGVLYGDGFEKSFLALDGTFARVVEAENGVLGVVVTAAGREDPRRVVEKRVDYYRLGQSGSRVSRLVEGICPSSIRLAERALELRSSLKASVKDGNFRVYR